VVEVRGGRAYPILRSTGQPVRSGSLSFHREQPLAPRPQTTEPERSPSLGTNATAHPPLAASGPYLPSLSLAPSARHDLRQEPYAGNSLVRIRAGGTEQSVSLPRHPYTRCRRQRAFDLTPAGHLGQGRTPESDSIGPNPSASGPGLHTRIQGTNRPMETPPDRRLTDPNQGADQQTRRSTSRHEL
jgi:hypothetical protein